MVDNANVVVAPKQEKVGVRTSLKYGWQITKKNWKYLGLLTFVLLAINALPRFIISNLGDNLALLSVAVNFLSWLLSMFLQLGLLGIIISLAGGKVRPVNDLFSVSKGKYFKYAVATVLVGVITVLGFILLFIPGVILSVRLQFFKYLILEQDMGPVESIKESWRITKGETWKLLRFGGASFLVSLVGVLALGVGLLITAPLITLAQLYLYRNFATSHTT